MKGLKTVYICSECEYESAKWLGKCPRCQSWNTFVEDVVEKWASVYDPDNVPTPGETKDITVKAKVPAAWTNTITAWVWADGLEGEWKTPTKDGKWYVITENCNKLNVIFVNGTNWGGNANQTEDMSFTANTCIQLTQSGDAKAQYTQVDCGDTTSVDNVEIDQPQARKLLYNGTLYLIMPNGDIYNAAGVLVNKQ